jgi:hypothetical protein
MQFTGSDRWERTSLSSFLGNLPELLGALAAERHAVAAIAEFEDFRYVQVLVDEGWIEAEVISNTNVPDRNALTSSQERLLERAGWMPPGDRSPNWLKIGFGVESIFSIATSLSDATVRILGQRKSGGGNEVRVKTFPVLERRRRYECKE